MKWQRLGGLSGLKELTGVHMVLSNTDFILFTSVFLTVSDQNAFQIRGAQ